jgi:hypothetical protein
MPKFNPKHMKKATQEKPMGVKRELDKCMVKGCTEQAEHHIAASNLDNYMGELKWELTVSTDQKKTPRGGLCKKHYKDYKKLVDKDEKYTKIKTFDSQKPYRDKPHINLE